ncbi:MAG: tRNA (guanosine(37)-N1)-methyltransferase TrmD [Planctomycetota bacterium]
MRMDFISVFPEIFGPALATGMFRIAREKGLASFFLHDLRDWSGNRHRKVDDRPFGGGPGMVMRAGPVAEAVEDVRGMAERPGRLLFLAPDGERFCQARARSLAGEERLLFVCGRYEGFDERIFRVLAPERISIGDYILTGGELAALVVADAVVRLLPGVVGSPESLERESFERCLLDHPQYTQPAVWRGLAVPEVLRSGDHAAIEAWRAAEALRRTRERRPDLVEGGGSPRAGESVPE